MEDSMAFPKLSIVTICYNSEEFIGETFSSVREQDMSGCEYVVIDGVSTDGTLAIIEDNQDIIDVFCSEPDRGISDAMNKGIELSQGEYIFFLHSDDFFNNSTALMSAVAAINSGEDIVVFDVMRQERGALIRSHARSFNIFTYLKMPFCHQGVICRRSLFNRIGGFDLDFKITMDYDFFLRAKRSGVSCKLVDDVLSVFRDGGVSSKVDSENLKVRFGEEESVHFKNSTSSALDFAYSTWWFIYHKYLTVKWFFKR